jgi:hypothetical protein
MNRYHSVPEADAYNATRSLHATILKSEIIKFRTALKSE